MLSEATAHADLRLRRVTRSLVTRAAFTHHGFNN
jgi:hypothetical protein